MTATPPGQISYRAEVARKAIHLIALVIPAGMWLLGKEWSVAILVPLAVVVLLTDVLRSRYAWANSLVRLLFGWMMRRHELPPVGGPVAINGASWVILSSALLAVLFPLYIAIAAFTVFMLADAMAALVGRGVGRIKWPSSARTVEGSLAFLVSGVALMLLFPEMHLFVGAVAVLFGCIAEALPRPFNDNLRVPLVMASVIFLLDYTVLARDIRLFF
jgi:dolichol kinase